eukprot:snap_masked-scaffold_12-processed-gene-7.16-mRNA-1 protein AED:1.00 eAED:1.00 QI:0/0/0/0/1/1/2/0/79
MLKYKRNWIAFLICNIYKSNFLIASHAMKVFQIVKYPMMQLNASYVLDCYYWGLMNITVFEIQSFKTKNVIVSKIESDF